MVTDPQNGLVHVAGIVDAAEAEMLVDCGVTHLGFPLVLGYHDEDLTVDQAADIVSAFGHRATFFLITYLSNAADVLSLCHRLGVAMVQLHGDVGKAELAKLREAAPGYRILKSLIVRANGSEREGLSQLARDVETFAGYVDAFITDTFDPATGASGATGKTHDWSISRRLVELSPKPVLLAGGLTPNNVGAAIRAVGPAGVDVHTGIEGADGRKQEVLTRGFLAEALAAFRRGGDG